MKLGLCLHPEKWTDRHLALARQLGCETVIAWVPFGAGDGVWHLEDFVRIREQAAKHGLVLEGIENFHPQHLDHVVLDEPGKEEQMANLIQTVENAGKSMPPPPKPPAERFQAASSNAGRNQSAAGASNV